jgi:hypothetical protein
MLEPLLTLSQQTTLLVSWPNAARAIRQELDLREIDLASRVGAILGAIEMTVVAVNTTDLKRLLA